MSRRAVLVALVVGLVLSLTAACGGDSGDEASSATAPTSPTTTSGGIVLPTAVPPTLAPPPDGVDTYAVTSFHTEAPVVYDLTPPVGGPHPASAWQPCFFYEEPVPTNLAVHSLEHGAIWITYRPDLPAEQREVIRQLALRRADVLASRWDTGLPAPVVVSSWGRQLKLESAHDPRLEQFARAFADTAPESAAPC